MPQTSRTKTATSTEETVVTEQASAQAETTKTARAPRKVATTTKADAQLEALLEMRDFFRRHKQEISKELGESDNALREALKDIKDTSYYSVAELKRQIVEQNEAFKGILTQELATFTDYSNAMRAQFDQQIRAYPSIAERLDDMAEMPHKLDRLINKMEQYNWQLVENINGMIKRIDQRREGSYTAAANKQISSGLKWTLIVTLPIITISLLFIAVFAATLLFTR